MTVLPKRTRGEEVWPAVTVHSGNAENLKGLETAASLLPERLTRGTRKLSYQQLRDELDPLKAVLVPGGGGRGGRGGASLG